MTRDQLKKLENDLWAAADKLRANSDLKASEYSTPVLGLIFLKFADNKYRQHEQAILAEYRQLAGTRRERSLHDIAIERCGFALGPQARYDHLLGLPEQENIPKAIRAAMASIEASKPELQGVLPQLEYDRFNRSEQNKAIPKALLKLFSDIPVDAAGDVFGQIYEYFLANFALSEGQGGGEFFTPRSVVRLMVEVIEPHGGKVFDPACGSGGMFVQSAQFIERHREDAAADLDVYVCGSEKTLETVKLAKMNLAVNGLRGQVMQANAYYEDPFGSFGAFDYVLANPPFNVDDVVLGAVEKDRRFNTWGVPRNKGKPAGKGGKGRKGEGAASPAVETVPNANYLWINLFATSLKANGRAALVMANSASDARHSEADYPPHAGAEQPDLRHADAAVEPVLHRHAAGHAVVLRPRQGRRARAVRRRAQRLHADRPRAPRAERRADRQPRRHPAAAQGPAPRVHRAGGQPPATGPGAAGAKPRPHPAAG